MTSAFGQGTVLFNNRVPGTVDARWFVGNQPMGAGWTVQLFGGPASTPIDNLTPLFPTTTFMTGTREDMGYVNPVIVTVSGVRAGSTATVAMRAFADALPGCFAVSGTIQVLVGGEGMPPGNLVGLRPLDFTGGLACIPEPSVFFLGLFGAGVIFLFRYKLVLPS
jgi:hypothetical protein